MRPGRVGVHMLTVAPRTVHGARQYMVMYGLASTYVLMIHRVRTGS
jgi:hypothetical protein